MLEKDALAGRKPRAIRSSAFRQLLISDSEKPFSVARQVLNAVIRLTLPPSWTWGTNNQIKALFSYMIPHPPLDIILVKHCYPAIRRKSTLSRGQKEDPVCQTRLSDLVNVVRSIGVYQSSVQRSALACVQTLWESLQMLCEFCTQLGVVGQPVAEKTGHAESHDSKRR